MATIACPNCDREINAAATRCKYCGWAPGQPTVGQAASGQPVVIVQQPAPARKSGHPVLMTIGIGLLVCVGLGVVAAIVNPNTGTATPTQAPLPTLAAGRQPVPGGVVTTDAPAPPTATPQPVGTRQRPVPRGEAYTFRKGSQTFSIEVIDVQKNALASVKKANMFNTDPPDGEDYVMVKVRLRYLEGGQDRPMKTESGDHRFYADNRFWGAPTSSIPLEPAFRGQDVFPNATVEGWLAGKHLPKALMDQAVLVYDGVYFGL